LMSDAAASFVAATPLYADTPSPFRYFSSFQDEASFACLICRHSRLLLLRFRLR